ncbi:MAG: metal-dependent transcriptional regulator [Chloroflexi bacterium]|nr:MAG: metal-dependent transcriptional regulator [Chloroflexota bacterium]
MTQKLSDVLEMYLKTVLMLEREFNPVRISHIAKARGVSAASVTEATQTLREKGLILHRSHGGVRLSAKGRRMALAVEARHAVLHGFLTEILGVEDRVAGRDACEIEHVASTETMDRLTVLLEYLKQSEDCMAGFLKKFRTFSALRAEKE